MDTDGASGWFQAIVTAATSILGSIGALFAWEARARAKLNDRISALERAQIRFEDFAASVLKEYEETRRVNQEKHTENRKEFRILRARTHANAQGLQYLIGLADSKLPADQRFKLSVDFD